jgi:lambda repressor-like predicted transcriptional regulator
MSDYQNKKRKQIKLSRLEIVAELYKRGYSMREVQAEVMKRLGIKTYSLQTVQRDIHSLLREWRENRIDDTDQSVQLELERIDDAVRELWEQWEKSKQDYTKTANKKKGAPIADKKNKETKIQTFQTEKTETEVIRLGDVSYLAEIRAQLTERRKILGLYAPEKKDVTVNEFDFNGLTPEQRQVLLQVGEQILNEKE